jgi:hypothetical protein
VIDVVSNEVEPYNKNGVRADMAVTKRIDDTLHPFYEKFHIDVPHGIKGDSVNNFHVEVANNDITEYSGKSDDVNNGRQVLVYNYYKYDTLQNPTPVKLYLGDYNMIEDVSMNSEGLITVKYTHNNDKNL